MEKEFQHSAADNALDGRLRFDGKKRKWQVKQDIKPFVEEAKQERDIGFNKKANYRKFATIPDVVAIEIATKYGVNIHDENTQRDKNEMSKFKKIIIQNYPYLLVST